jgi:hypothetical protein
VNLVEIDNTVDNDESYYSDYSDEIGADPGFIFDWSKATVQEIDK